MPVTSYQSTQRNISEALNDHECILSSGNRVADCLITYRWQL